VLGKVSRELAEHDGLLDNFRPPLYTHTTFCLDSKCSSSHFIAAGNAAGSKHNEHKMHDDYQRRDGAGDWSASSSSVQQPDAGARLITPVAQNGGPATIFIKLMLD